MGYPVRWYSVPLDSVDRLIADRYFGILACYLRDDEQVFETYWTSGRGNELMPPARRVVAMAAILGRAHGDRPAINDICTHGGP